VFARRKATLAAVLGTTALVPALVGCGDDDGGGGPASAVPPDSPVYVEAAVRPEGDRAAAIEGLSQSITGVDDPGERIVALIDQSFAGEGVELTYAEDIEPWLGESGALFVRSLEPAAFTGGMADAAAVVEVTDTDAAQSFLDDVAADESSGDLEERTYEDVSYLADAEADAAVGLVDELMVAGTEDSFKASVDATSGESLADDETFSEQLGDLDADNLAELWLDLGTILDAATESAHADGTEIDAARAALGPLLDEPLTASLAATPETVTLETSAAGESGTEGDTEALGALPSDAWLALALGDAGTALSQTLEGLGSLGSELGDPSLDPEAIASAVEAETGLDLEDDILGWIGSAAFYLAGTSEAAFQGAAILGTDDREASAKVIDAGREAVERQSGRDADPPLLDGAEDGFSATGPTGEALEVVLADDEVVAALGGSKPAQDALEPAETLADSELFASALEALGDDHEASAYVALQDFLLVAEKGGQADDFQYQLARPYLDALQYLIFGTASDGERELSRLVLGVGEGA